MATQTSERREVASCSEVEGTVENVMCLGRVSLLNQDGVRFVLQACLANLAISLVRYYFQGILRGFWEFLRGFLVNLQKFDLIEPKQREQKVNHSTRLFATTHKPHSCREVCSFLLPGELLKLPQKRLKTAN